MPSGSAGAARPAASRWPWLTWAVAAACLGLHFIWVGAGAPEAPPEAVAATRDYLERHPYLDPGPALAPHVDVAALRAADAKRVESRNRRGLPPIPRAVVARQQEELDHMIRDSVPVGVSPVDRYGLHPGGGSPLSLVAHLPLHAGTAHLLGCVALLLALGGALEQAAGSAALGLVLASASAASAVAFAALATGEQPWLGSGGALAGVIAATAVLQPRRLAHPVHATTLLAGAAFLAAPLAGIDTPWWQAPAGAGWALLGGAACGALAGAVLRGIAPVSEPEVARRPRGVPAPDLEAQWTAATGIEETAAAAAAMLAVIREEVRSGSGAVVAHWLELCHRELESLAEPALLIRLAPVLAKHGHPELAVSGLQQALARCGDESAAVVAARVARGARDLDPELARRAAWKALQSPDLALEERQQLEALLERVQPRGVSPFRALETHAEAAPPSAAAPSAAEGVDAWEDPELSEEAEPAEGPSRPRPIELDLSAREAQVVEAVPVELEEGENLVISARGGVKKRVPLTRVEAVSVVSLDGLADRAVIVIDLLLNWSAGSGEPLKVIRMRCDRFDPRALVPGCEEPQEALRAFTSQLLRRSGAMPLPDIDSVRGYPFAAFADLHSYQRDVLGVEPPEDAPTG